MLLASFDKRVHKGKPSSPPAFFTSAPPDLHLSAEYRVLILLDPSANAQALDPNVLASGIR